MTTITVTVTVNGVTVVTVKTVSYSQGTHGKRYRIAPFSGGHDTVFTVTPFSRG